VVDFGDRLRHLREARSLSQARLAGKLGITKSMVSAYENGIRLPSHDVFIKIADFFNISTDYLYGRNNTQFIDTAGLPDEKLNLVSLIVEEFKREYRKP